MIKSYYSNIGSVDISNIGYTVKGAIRNLSTNLQFIGEKSIPLAVTTGSETIREHLARVYAAINQLNLSDYGATHVKFDKIILPYGGSDIAGAGAYHVVNLGIRSTFNIVSVGLHGLQWLAEVQPNTATRLRTIYLGATNYQSSNVLLPNGTPSDMLDVVPNANISSFLQVYLYKQYYA